MSRLFIAVCFNLSVTKKLAALRDMQRTLCPRARFSADENLHLTLEFLGEVPDCRIDSIKRAIDSVHIAPMQLMMHGEEKLGSGLLCLSVYRTPELMRLQSELRAELIREGFKVEAREFRPHVTLAREFYPSAPPRLDEHIRAYAAHVSLMRSERIGGKPVYSVVYSK